LKYVQTASHHCIAQKRKSRTLLVSAAFLDAFIQQHPDWSIDSLDLFTEKLPAFNTQNITNKYALSEGKTLDITDAWKTVFHYIDRFKTADMILISSPMWNFSIPYPLKHFIDLIVQPKSLFEYQGNTVVGLMKGKKNGRHHQPRRRIPISKHKKTGFTGALFTDDFRVRRNYRYFIHSCRKNGYGHPSPKRDPFERSSKQSS
jgi:hypothetical protein